MPVKRDKIKPPTLPRKAFPCAALGGEVVIQGPLASARIKLEREVRIDSSVDHLAPLLLADSVLDADLAPIFTAAEWDVWGGSNYAAYMDLFNEVMGLWGFDEARAQKNS